MPGCAKSSGHANLGSIEAKNLDSQTLSVLHKEDLVGTEKNGKPDNGDEREEQQRMHETCGKQLFEHDKVQAMDQGAQQSTQKVCSSYEGEEDYSRCASGGYGGVSRSHRQRRPFKCRRGGSEEAVCDCERERACQRKETGIAGPTQGGDEAEGDVTGRQVLFVQRGQDEVLGGKGPLHWLGGAVR